MHVMTTGGLTSGLHFIILSILSGIHASEWISPAVVTYMMRELTENITGQQELVDELDWYIVPSVNPDGYVYTWSDDRLWRKTRSPNEGSPCMGTDPNRNFDFQWATVGTSDQPCSETFHGSEPFSEAETRNVRDFVLPLKDQLKHFIDVHSYSQIVITPWGYTSEVPDDWDEVGKMRNHGTTGSTITCTS